MKLPFILFAVLVTLVCLGSASTRADGLAPIDIGGDHDGTYLTGQAEVSVVGSGIWTPLDRDGIERGFTDDNFLLRFSLTNSADRSRTYVLSHDIAFLDRLRVSVESSSGGRSDTVLGNDLPFEARQVEYPGLAYRGTLAPGERALVTVGIEMFDPQPMALALRLWDAHSFERHAVSYSVEFAVIATILITMAVTWAIFALAMQRWQLLLYSGYLGFSGCLILGFYGLAYQFVFWDAVAAHHVGFQPMALLAFGFAALFAVAHLELPRRMPRIAKITRLIGCTLLVLGLIALLGLPKAITIPCSMVALLVPFWIMVISIPIAWRYRDLSTALFALAWSIVGLTGISVFLLVGFDALPIDWTAAQTYQALSLVTLVEVLILTLSVAFSVRNLQNERDQAAVESRIDPLTRLLNRRGLEAMASAVMGLEARDTWWVALFDIDRFKHVNDTHGHAAGDSVLMRFADLLREHARQSDTTCRIGGEEFVILFEAGSAEIAVSVCERIRIAFATKPTRHADIAIQHTVSVGLTRAPGIFVSLDQLISPADAALYRAKHAGRNRVILADRNSDEAA